MNHLVLTRQALNVAEISNIVSADSCGATSLFIGTTRDYFDGKKVVSLEYEAYEPMALKQIKLICEELRRQWPDIVNVAIYHRLGLVEVREASVVICISSPHRKTSLDAVAAAIDELKKRVPIWKKEMYKDEDSNWKENKESEVDCGDRSSLFCETMCDIEELHPLPSQLIQISACEVEMKRRIQCFVEKKRNEIDLCNVMDFTNVKRQSPFNSVQYNVITAEEDANSEKEDESMTCARINSIIIKQENSKCHLKVRQVENDIGPQMRTNYFKTLDRHMESLQKDNIVSKHLTFKQKEGNQDLRNRKNFVIWKYIAILERLQNIEEHIRLPPSSIENIFHRLKVIEDRILYLESVSPEYRHFLFDIALPNGTSTYERRMYSVSEIDNIIQNFDGD